MVSTQQILNFPLYDSILSEEEKADYLEIFDNNMPYMIEKDEDGLKWVITDNIKVPFKLNLRDYYKLPAPESVQQLSEDNAIEVSEETLQLAIKWQKARLVGGYWFEYPTQLALSYANIPFKGNPMNLQHYPRSVGLSVDVHTEKMLIECTNPKYTSWLEDEILEKKIDYFYKADPEHKKSWVLVTSFDNWSKAIKERLRTSNITVIKIGVHLNSRNWKRFWLPLSKLFKELNKLASYLKDNNKINNEYLQEQQTNLYLITCLLSRASKRTQTRTRTRTPTISFAVAG